MPPIAAGVFLTSISNLYSNILVYYKKTKYIMFAAIAAAVVNVALNLVAIPLFGYGAAAYTTLASYIILAVSQRRGPPRPVGSATELSPYTRTASLAHSL